MFQNIKDYCEQQIKEIQSKIESQYKKPKLSQIEHEFVTRLMGKVSAFQEVIKVFDDDVAKFKERRDKHSIPIFKNANTSIELKEGDVFINKVHNDHILPDGSKPYPTGTVNYIQDTREVNRKINVDPNWAYYANNEYINKMRLEAPDQEVIIIDKNGNERIAKAGETIHLKIGDRVHAKKNHNIVWPDMSSLYDNQHLGNIDENNPDAT